MNHASTADIKETQPEGLKENQPSPPKAGALKRPATAQRKKNQIGTTNFMQTQNTAKQKRPNHEAAKSVAAEQQGGPIFGPLTEKEHLRAIKTANLESIETLKREFKEAMAAMPPEPPLASVGDVAFADWLKANHGEVYNGFHTLPTDKEKRLYRTEAIEPLFYGPYQESEECLETFMMRRRWSERQAKLKEVYEAARAPHEAAIEEARKRWDEIATKTAREAEVENRIRYIREALFEEIGCELAYGLKVHHPDFDGETFEEFNAWRIYDEDRQCDLNCILHGAPGTGKTRAMAHWATRRENIQPYGEYSWITGAQFAELVGGLADNERRAEAKERLRELAQATTLYFDDLGSAHFTAARISHFFALMDARYKGNLPTIFTTNHRRKEIRVMLSGSGSKDDAVTADRILRRIVGTPADPRCTFFEFKRRKGNATT